MARLGGLGKGLGALIPAEAESIAGDSPRLVDLPIDSIIPNQHQPRVHFDEESLAELAASIREIGVLGVDLNAAIGAILPDLRRDKGIVVALVAAGTPYSQQGRLAAGDVIYAINNKPVEGVERLKAALAALAPNDPFVLQVEREGTLLYLSFKVER